MTKASDNVFPRFLISEGGSTATPASGRVTLYAKADGLLYSKDDAGVETLVSSGTAATETWETAVTALTGKVHRWKFEEASGDFNDEISTLDLVANGSITYSVGGPLGNGVSFTGGFAESSGLGSIPTGDAERTILIVWKKTAVGTSALLPLFSYGANSSRQLFQLYGTSIAALTFTMVTDSVALTQSVGDGEYHISAALHNDAGNAQSAIYQDGELVGLVNGGALNTSAANNFHIAAEYDDTDPAAITVTDCIVFSRWLAKHELDRLYNALIGELS